MATTVFGNHAVSLWTVPLVTNIPNQFGHLAFTDDEEHDAVQGKGANDCTVSWLTGELQY